MFRTLCIVLLLAPLAAGQTMYATNEQLSGGTSNIDYAASAVAPEAGKAYAAFGQGATTYTTAFEGHFDQDYLAGEWTVQLFLSCDRPTAYRPTTTTNEYRPSVKATVFVNTDAVGDVFGESTLRTCDGPSDVWALELPIESSIAPMAGNKFRMEVNIWWSNPPPGDAQNGYFLVGGDQPSGLTGLIAAQSGPERQLINTTLSGDFAPVFSNATHATYNVTFAAAQGQELRLAVGGSNGTAAIDVFGNGTVYSRNGTAWNDTVVLDAGSYYALVNLTGYVGSLRLGVHDPAPLPSEDGAGNETAAPEPDAPEEGSSPVEDEGKAIPVGPVALVALLVAARRRR